MSGWRYPWAWRNCVGAWCPSRDRVRGSSQLTDQSTAHNNGTLTNMDPATDWIISPGAGGGYALDFDGSNDYIATQWNLLTDFVQWPAAVSLWFYTRNTATRQTLLGDMNAAGSTCSTDIEISGYAMSSGYVGSGAFLSNPTGTGTPIQTLAAITANKWYHLVVTSNGDSTAFLLYLDGRYQATKTTTPTPPTYDTHKANFGKMGAYSAAGWLNGQIDDIRLYNRALTPSEIAQLYRLGRGGAYALEYVPIGKAGAAAPVTRNDNLLLLGVS